MIGLIAAILMADAPPPVFGSVNGGGITVGVGPVASSVTPSAPASNAPGGGYPKQTLVPACQTNAACVTDLDCPGGLPYYIYTQAGPTDPPVNTLQSVCVHDSVPTDTSAIPDDVVTLVEGQWQKTPLDNGQAHTSPADTVPIGVPVLLHVSGATHVDTTFTLAGIPLHLKAVESFTWAFGDGTTLTTSNPGRAYDPDRPPEDPTYTQDYVSHGYDAPGSYVIAETTSWSHVTVTRTDTGATVTLPGRATTAPTQSKIEVVELRSELTTP